MAFNPFDHKQEEECYWYDSKMKAFQFEEKEEDDDLSTELSEGLCLGEEIKNIPSSHSKSTIPLKSLINEEALNCILNIDEPQKFKKLSCSAEEEVRFLRRQIEDRWKAPPIEDTIRRIFLGQPYSLELYKSFDEKTRLLDAAIRVGDGNAILSVILMIVQTLKKSLVCQLFRTRPEAIDIYVKHLSLQMKVDELTDLFQMLGMNKEASMKQFELTVKNTNNPQRKLQQLYFCSKNNLSLDSSDIEIINNYIKLIEWQMIAAGKDGEIYHNLMGNSVIDSFAYACKFYWELPKDSRVSPVSFSQEQNICRAQYEWTVLNVRASLGTWDDVEKLFVSKRWLNSKQVTASVPMENIVSVLHSKNAPKNVLLFFLLSISNLNERFELAKSVDCSRDIIDVYSLQKDRQGLVKFISYLDPTSDDYFYAQSLLSGTSLK